MGVGRSSSLRTTAERSPLHDVRQHAARRSFDRSAANYRCMDEQRLRGCAPSGGARRNRTDDLLLAKQALSQLSYGPSRCRRLVRMVGLGRFELPTSRLSSARSNQLSYKPKLRYRVHTLAARATQSSTGNRCSNDLWK